MKLFAVLMPLAIAISACGYSGDRGGGVNESKKCFYRGNDPSFTYCATTYIQILTDPDYFENKRVMIAAWGYSDGDITLIFPSEDSLLAVEDNASILVHEKKGERNLSTYLVARQYGAGRVVVGGVLRLQSSDSRASLRFGVIEEAVLIR